MPAARSRPRLLRVNFIVGCLAFFAPRVTIVVLQLATGYVTRAYETLLWPLLGFLFLPLTTLAYAWAKNSGGSVEGFRLIVVVLAVLIDLGLIGTGRSSLRRKRGEA
ncbi:MAG TPA: hypothetical protein VMT18_06545 [Planctomycetota bacterium]|nr:hypothetical protein [Planctomycetota bacterium]